MSNTFNFNRFGKYFTYELKSHWSNSGIMVGIFALFPIIWYVVWKFFGTFFNKNILQVFSTGFPEIDGPQLVNRFWMFAILLIIFVIVFPAKTYGHVTDKAAGSQWLMLPASRLEKFLSMALNTLVVMPLVFFGLYFLSDYLICLIDKSCGIPLTSFRINGVNEDVFASWFLIVLNPTLVYSSIFLLGAILFKKNKAFKTIAVLLALNMVISLFFGLAMTATTDGIEPGRLEVWMNGTLLPWLENHIEIVDTLINTIVNTVLAITLIIIWSLVWVRLKRLQH